MVAIIVKVPIISLRKIYMQMIIRKSLFIITICVLSVISVALINFSATYGVEKSVPINGSLR